MSLCKVVAIFDELQLKNVESVLIDHGVSGFTLLPVRGRGRYFDSFNDEHLVKHIQMEIYAAVEHATGISRLIADTAQCNADSGGLVSVVPISNLLWIHEKREATVNDFTLRETNNVSENE